MLRLLPSASRPRAATATTDVLPPLGVIAQRGARRVLSFDIENRPLSYWYDGKCTAEITAIAWKWVGSKPGEAATLCLGEERTWDDAGGTVDMRSMLTVFRVFYVQADVVTGHYIRKHDLPIINAAMIENGLPQLAPKLTSDTRLDLVRFGELAKSQEALGAMLGLEAPKEHMTQSDWREANRLTPAGIEQTRRRVIGDVEQHVELRAALIKRGLLGPPRWWNPGGARIAA